MRLVSLSPAVTEILFALKKGGEIVCRDGNCNYPEEARNIEILKSASELGSYSPELVFTSGRGQRELAEGIRAQGIQCVHQEPGTLDDVWQSFIEIGILLDSEDEAQELSKKSRQGMNAVKDKARKLPEKLRTLVITDQDPVRAGGLWIPEIVRLAGGKPFPVDREEGDAEIYPENISDFKPDVLILFEGEREFPFADNAKIFLMEENLLTCPGPRLVEGAQRLYAWLFELLH